MIIELDEITLNFYESVIEIMKTYVQNDYRKDESGGILVGYMISDTRYSITDISVPNKGERSSRFSFNRSKREAQNFINKKYIESQKKKIYLGEWHTHPEKVPLPSTTDIKSIKRQYKENILNTDVVFMVIMGITDVYVTYVEKASVGGRVVFKHST